MTIASVQENTPKVSINELANGGEVDDDSTNNTPMEDIETIETDTTDNGLIDEETNDVKNDISTEEKSKSEPSTTTRPFKKARTAYFIFADDKRREFKEKGIHHKSVAIQAREIGQLWSNLPTEDKEEYKLLASKEKEMKQQPSITSSNASNGLPISKMRKIIKLDPELKSISKEALLLLTKSCELFTSKLGLDTNNVAKIQNRRTLILDDIVEICESREQFLFLKEDIKDFKQEVLRRKKDSVVHDAGKKGAIHQYFTTL